MSVVCRDPAAPRVPGSCYGGVHDFPTKAARCYGDDGDLCQQPSCRCVLSRYNPLDTCGYHGVGGRKRPPRRRGSASAAGTAGTKAALEPRRVTIEEVEMAARTRQKTKEIDVAVEAFARSQEWATYFTAAECARACGCGESTAKRRLTRLVESGLLSSSTSHGYCLVKREDSDRWRERNEEAQEALSELCADEIGKAHVAEDAPVPIPEQPATPAAPDPTPPQEPPAAGVTTSVDTRAGEAMTVKWFSVGSTEPSEATLLGYLEAMDDEARDRVLTYACSRWPTRCEVVVRADGMPSSEQIAEAVLGAVERGKR